MDTATVPRVIDRKKRGQPLTADEWTWIVRSFTAGAIPEYQMSALLMAVWFQGLTNGETAALTDAMMRSGRCLDLSAISRPTVDKHSTGGVGDKVSLALAPVVAAAGGAVPMVSGRSLGHTGGTLDKLAAIPGFRTGLSIEEFVSQVERVGCAITGQSPDMAPADGKMYALRDVTATVDCVPLIAASIMSKKLAAGPQGIVFDVKVGRGAFMQTLEDARNLSRVLLGIGHAAGRRCTALLTDMEQPLGWAVGNALEVREAIALLQDRGPADLRELTLALAAEMLVVAGVAVDAGAGWTAAERALVSGAARKTFIAMVEAQGGDGTIVDRPEELASAPVVKELVASRAGYVARLDARTVGEVARVLGAGRATVQDEVDPRVGIVLHAKVGALVEAGVVLADVHAADECAAGRAVGDLNLAVEIVSDPVPCRTLVMERMDHDGLSPWSHPLAAFHD